MWGSKLDWTFALVFTVTAFFSIYAFPFLAHIPIDIVSSVVGLKICAITAETKTYNSIIKKTKSMIKLYC